MKRILFFMHTSSQIGGVETWLDRAHGYLSSRGFEPIVGLVRGQQYNDPTRYKAYHPDIQTVEVDGRGLNREGRVRALERCIRELEPEIAVPMGIVDAYESVIRCKLRGQKVRLLARAQGNLAPMLADLASYRNWIDRVICPGRLTRQVLTHWAAFQPERVLGIPNGAYPSITPRGVRQPGAPLRVGYVGRLTELDKRALDLIELNVQLETVGIDYTLDIIGDGPCRRELEEAFAEHPRVRMHGPATREDLYTRIFPSLDALVLLSSSESFGTVLVEAMMHGVVPVTSRYAGFHAEQLVQEGKTGLAFPIGDMAGAAAAIERLANDQELLSKLGAAALAHAASFTWETTFERWELALNELLEEPPVPGGGLPPAPPESGTGFLDRLGLPLGVVDAMRRARRSVLGSAVPAGGEEWPLYYRHHSAALLAEIEASLKALDVPADTVAPSSQVDTAHA